MSEKPTYEELEQRVQGLEQVDSERKRTEKAFLEIEEKYNLLIQSSQTGIYIHVGGLLKFVNNRFAGMLGYVPNEMVGKQYWDFVRPEDKKMVKDISLARARGEAAPLEYDFRHLGKNGETVWVHNLPTIIQYQGQTANMGNLVQINDRKRAEERLRESEHRYKCLFENCPAGIGIADHEGNIVEFNDAMFEAGGYCREDFAQIKKVTDLYYNPEQRSKIIQKAAQNGFLNNTEVLLKREDGSPYTALLQLRPIKFNGKKCLQAVVQDIEERKQAEEEKALLLARIKTTLEATADGILVVDRNGKQVLFSTRFAKMWKIPDEIIQTKNDDHVLKFVLGQLKDPDSFLAKVKQLYAKPEAKSFDTIEFKDGRIFERYSRPHKLDDKIIGRVWSFRDVTKQKLADNELKRERKRYQELVENLNDVIFLVDTAGVITYVSPRIESVLGYTSEDLIKSSFVHLIHPDDQDLILRAFKNVLGGQLQPSEYRIKSKSGMYKWVRTSSRPIQENGQVVGVQGVLIDITDRIEAEQVIRVSESKFRNLFEMSPQAIALTDVETGKLIDVNDKFCELTQYSKEEIVGRTTVEAGFYSDEKRNIFIHELKACGKVDGIEMEFKSKSGSGLTALMSARVVKILERPIILTAFNDITTQKRLEDQLRQSHKLEAIGTLAGGIAHEFNNMLGIIIGNTELALDDIPEWNPATDCIEEIRNAGLRAKDVVRKLLRVAQKTPAARKPLHIQTVVKESLDLMRRIIPATIDLKSDLSCTTEIIMGVPTELSQILLNLCTNSVHALGQKTGVIEVNLEAIQLDRHSVMRYQDLQPGDYAKLTVRDSGDGIEPNLTDRVFDPYFTTKDVDEGLGMGLAVVKGIVRNHDGAIKIESEVGKGTTVEILFPLIEEQEMTSIEKTDTPLTGTERILFVDDEAPLVKMVTLMLERLGYEVVGKASSSEALRLFEENPERFDLVITDMAMPDITGDRLAQEITRIRPNIPIILCTGYSDRMNENRSKELGISAFAMKPFEKADLTYTVRKVLDEAKG